MIGGSEKKSSRTNLQKKSDLRLRITDEHFTLFFKKVSKVQNLIACDREFQRRTERTIK